MPLLQVQIFAVLILIANGLDFEFGDCPTPEAIDDIDLEQLSGKWYEIERFDDDVETDMKCGEVSIVKLSDSEISMETYAVSENGESPLDYNFNATLTPDDPSKAIFSIDVNVGIPGISQPVLYVLDTDYKTYLVLWSCLSMKIGFLKLEVAWIFARNRELSEDVIDKLHDRFREQNLDDNKFVSENQGDCQ